MLAERYVLQKRLGSGGHGDVWESGDRLGGDPVAVKLLRPEAGATSAQLGIEVSILRLHQVPGVVRLLDEHFGEPFPYIVMELVRGEPFPGKGRHEDWSAMTETTVSLIETLVRLHAEGVVHKDLKPANVLVDAAGKPTLLDFGIASDRLLQDLPDDDYVDGTVHYMAPERLRGETPTPQQDLYSLGVLLFEALTGKLPHRGERELAAFVRARVSTPAPAVRSLSPDAPPAIAGLVDLLLRTDPDRRPRSAIEVLGMLTGHPRGRASEPRFARLGSHAAREAVLERVRGGRAVDVVGARATGRSRCLEEIRAALQQSRIDAVVLRPAGRAFTSLLPVTAALPEPSARLVEAADLVVARVRAALEQGVVILADDVDRMDRPSADALARCRDAGALVRVFEEGRGADGDGDRVRIAPLEEADLASLFAGPERLFHRRSDAARILHARTGGLPGRVSDELEEWKRAGAVAWDGERLVVSRDLLEQLDARVAPRIFMDVERSEVTPLPQGTDDLLVCLGLAYPDATPEIMAHCLRQPVWDIEAQIEELLRRGLARRRDDGSVEPTCLPPGARHWPLERRRADHRAIAEALPAGAPRRFFHLASALDPSPRGTDVTALAEEAIAVARRLMRTSEGDLRRAIVILQEAEFQIRRWPADAGPLPGEPEPRVLAATVELALADGTERVIGRARYEISRARVRTELVSRLEQLLEAALAFMAGGGRSLQLLDAIPPFADLALERLRQGLRARASRRCSAETEDATLADIARWAAGHDDPVTQARLAFWQGWWRYRRGLYADAARLHRRAAAGEPVRTARILALIACAAALMESFATADLEEAARGGDEALRDARESGSAYLEARAEWIRRALARRLGVAAEPDLELTDAAGELRAREVEASIYLTEGAIAYRAGRREDARALADKAAAQWRFVQNAWPLMLARCLALAARGATEPELADEIDELAQRAMECPVPGLGIQALGLLARACKGAPEAWRSAAPRLAGSVPQGAWPRPLDVLSVDEALDALRAPARDTPP